MSLLAATANAENAAANNMSEYEQCKMFVQLGDEAYQAKSFNEAEKNYLRARDINKECRGKKYIKARKLDRKISNCEYALSHGGKTHQEASADGVASLIGLVLAFGAIATAVSKTKDFKPGRLFNRHVDLGGFQTLAAYGER